MLTPGQSPDGARYCVSARGYEAMAKNAAAILRYVEEAKWRLDHYRKELGRGR